MEKMSYYQGKGMEAADVIEAFDLGFNLGNVIKYVLRFGKKGGKSGAIDDLKKAIQYLGRELQKLEKNERLQIADFVQTEDFKCCYCDDEDLVECFSDINVDGISFTFNVPCLKCYGCDHLFMDSNHMNNLLSLVNQAKNRLV